MNAAIYYHPEAYTTSGPKLMGRNAAGESFLRGFIRQQRQSHGFACTAAHNACAAMGCAHLYQYSG